MYLIKLYALIMVLLFFLAPNNGAIAQVQPGPRPLPLGREVEKKTAQTGTGESSYKAVAIVDQVNGADIDGFKIKKSLSVLGFSQTGNILFSGNTYDILSGKAESDCRVTFLDGKAIAYRGMQIGKYKVVDVEAVSLSKNGTYGFIASAQESDNPKKGSYLLIINGNIELDYNSDVYKEKKNIYQLIWKAPVMFNENDQYVLCGFDGKNIRCSIVNGHVENYDIYQKLFKEKDDIKPVPLEVSAAAYNVPCDKLFGTKPDFICNKPVYNILSNGSGDILMQLFFNDNNEFAMSFGFVDTKNNNVYHHTAIITGKAGALENPEVGDVIIYWQGDAQHGYSIAHSGYITKVDGSKVIGISCLLQHHLGEKDHILGEDEYIDNKDPNITELTTKFGSNWTIYKTNRTYKGKFIPNDKRRFIYYTYKPMTGKILDTELGLTDASNYILFLGKKNCHGYTFTDKNIPIGGYELSVKGAATPHGDNFDQGYAAELILRDNSYHQIHSVSVTGAPHDHYNPMFDVGCFKIPSP